MKKTIIASCMGLALCGSAFAASPALPVAPSGGANAGDQAVASAISGLGKEIEALAFSGVQWVDNKTYQNDPFFPSAPSNGASTSAATASQAGDKLTQKSVTHSLAEFPEGAVPGSALYTAKLNAKAKKRAALMPQLTMGVPASDTLYIANPIANMLAGIDAATKPKTTYDNYFNFDSLVTPNAYTASQQKAAKYYLQYLTKSYKSLTNGLDLAKLKLKLSSLPANERASWLKKNIIENPTYQKYQLAVRSTIAARTVATSNFQKMYAERKVVPGLGAAAGLPPQKGLKPGAASPLQVEDYAATNLVDNPAWYKEMKTAPASTVARQQLLLLATLVKEEHDNQLDNERLLATLSVLDLQMSQVNQQMSMAQLSGKVNKLFSSSSSSSDGASSADAASYEAKLKSESKHPAS